MGSFARNVEDRDNTATLREVREEGTDAFSVMQLTEDAVIELRWARAIHATQHHQPLQDPANFAVQNFVRRDGFRSWLQGLPDVIDVEQAFMLAVWRIHPALSVTYSPDRVLLQGGNLARQFRAFWRVNDDFKSPKVAAPEPQPVRLSGFEPPQIHLLAVENPHLTGDQMVHLFEVWKVRDATSSAGREFLARLAAILPRTITVRQVLQELGFSDLLQQAQRAVASFSLRMGRRRLMYENDDILKVPDFSLVDLVLVMHEEGQQMSQNCGMLLSSDQRPMSSVDSGIGPQMASGSTEGNTATSEVRQGSGLTWDDFELPPRHVLSPFSRSAHATPSDVRDSNEDWSQANPQDQEEPEDHMDLTQRFQHSHQGEFTRDLVGRRVWATALHPLSPEELHRDAFERVALQRTTILDFETIRQEYNAICRGDPDLVTIPLGNVHDRLEYSWFLTCQLLPLTLGSFVWWMRFELRDVLGIELEITAALTWPAVTLRESDQMGTLYLVGIQEVDNRQTPVLVVIWTMLDEGFHVQRIRLEAPRVIECLDLLGRSGRHMCSSRSRL